MTTTVRTNQFALADIAAQMTSGGRGILAADESIKTMSARLEGEGIPASATARRDYRQLLLTADGLSESISGIILCDETFGQEVAIDDKPVRLPRQLERAVRGRDPQMVSVVFKNPPDDETIHQ